ncbi:hypothetical protein [Rariglobus hedericola]|uniref:SGNH/GDSL hydrolase family protein n=1 Tax=Rariglobus hedericola TaxID=2597822 RepID=A0A556QPL0_9BACT|nr:hypothetical protein [Rariglobus hedericola]TSJ78567.1 hypothetical protein FPL22_04505 [Rariglobus hedericola]
MTLRPLSTVLLALSLVALSSASVRLSTDGNNTSAQYRTATGWALPEGDWTVGIWDNNFQGNGGWLVGHSAPGTGGSLNLFYDHVAGRYFVGGQDAAGNLFGGAKFNGIAGSLSAGYPGRPSGLFMPRLHIIRRRAGYSEYLVAEAGHAPVLVASEQRPFGATTPGNWCLGSKQGAGPFYDADLEGFFFATSAITDADLCRLSAGFKPADVASIHPTLAVYFPLESAAGDETVFKRFGPPDASADGPMLRGALSPNQRPADVAVPSQVVSLASFQPFQIIRHHKGSADIAFNGFDHGTAPADIELRFIDEEHQLTSDWQTLLQNSPGGGAVVQATLSVPKGYWKTMEVRRVRSAGGKADSNRPVRTWARWAVGEVVVVWGDSIQGQVDGPSRVNKVPLNGFTAKYPTASTPTLPGDTNPLVKGTWNLLHGPGMGGGSQGENLIANNLSEASGCCVGISVFWRGASQLDHWNGRTSSNAYNLAKVTLLANDGLNKPNVITWVGNCANARLDANASAYYSDFDLFKTVLDADLGADTWQLLIMPFPITYAPDTTPALGAHKVRDACWRWARDHGAYAGVSLDHTTKDGVHPTDAAWDLMGPRWGNAAGFLRDPKKFADPRAGEIVGFQRSGSDLIVQLRLFAGTKLTLKNPADSISGFTLSADNFTTTIPITSATLLGDNQVRITPATMPASPLKLRYLYGSPGAGVDRKCPVDPKAAGVDNLLYVNAGPAHTLAIQPIWSDAANDWSLKESGRP